MQVRKRNGSYEAVDLNKIVGSISRVCADLGDIDIFKVATKTVGGLVDGVSTRELDLLSIRNAVGLIIEDPVYSKVAARLLSNFILKEIDGQDIQSFSQSIQIGYDQGLINQQTYDLVTTNKRKLNAAIRHERDWGFEFHGIQTVYDRYLLKHPSLIITGDDGKKARAVIETPQYFLMRVACGLSNDAAEAVELYNLLSSLEYMASTPTLFNSGTVHSQMSSCYLLDSPLDSLEDIYKRYSDIAALSKFAGGIGVAASRIRSKGRHIHGTNGKSNGLVPWLHTLSGSVAAVNQGGKRKGAACVYLETHHPDIMQFLELRDNTGEKEARAYNLNLANWVPDLFMKRVQEDGVWSLIDPSVAPELTDLYGEEYEKRVLEIEEAGEFVEQISARKLYGRMMRTLAETGNGWMCFKDTSNRRGNQVGHGNVIHLSNLCVAPETNILTDTGNFPISSLHGKTVNVWNGEEFSETTVMQTGYDKKVIKVKLNNGSSLDCTPYHKFYVQNDYYGPVVEVRAENLKVGDKLIKSRFPIIEMSDEFPHAYTHGFFCGDGTYNGSGNPFVSLYADKKNLVAQLATKSGSGIEDAAGRLNYTLVDGLNPKFMVPHTASIADRLAWLAGLCDADGTVARNDKNESIQIGSIHEDFLLQIRLMLQTLGVDSKVTKMRDEGEVCIREGEKTYPTQPMFRLLISSMDTYNLLQLGFKCHRLTFSGALPNRNSSHFAKVVEILDEGRTCDTFCVSEPKRHMAVFNGNLTGNCTEILEVTSSGKKLNMSRTEMLGTSATDLIEKNIRVTGFNPKDDSFETIQGMETAVCNLGSINIGRNYVKNGKLNVEKLHRNVDIAVKYLDRVIDRNFYPIQEAESSNNRWRPVGLGLMGLADLFFQLRLPFESNEAITLSATIQEEIYYQALKTSNELAKTHGAHRDFYQTRAAKGDLQFDLAGVTPKDMTRWNALKESIIEFGLRNSLLIAIAPTATIAHITGAEECIEPIKSNLLKRETLSGEFIAINRYLVEDLKKLDRWDAETINILKRDEGSMQKIEGLPADFYALYKTVWEISQKKIIEHGAARGVYIDQSQSLNTFIDLNKYTEEKRIGVLSSLYMYAWEKGLKTTYYFRSRSASRIEKVTLSSGNTSAPQMASEEPEICESCT